MKTALTKNWVVIILAGICCLLWGSAFPCIKIGYKLFDISGGEFASQILFAGCRFMLAGVLVIATFSIINKEFIKPSSPKKIVTLSIFQTVVQYIPFYIGLAHATGVKSSIMNGTGVFVTIVVSCLIFKQEKMTITKIIGSVLGFIGVALVNLSGTNLNLDVSFLGEGMIMLSIISSAFSSSFIKRFSKDTNVVMLSGYQFFAGGFAMAIVGLLLGGRLENISSKSMFLLLYMAFISAAAYTLWSILLKYNNVSKVSAYKFMNPIFGAVLSYFILKESNQLGVNTLIALVLVCLGIYIVNRPKNVIK